MKVLNQEEYQEYRKKVPMPEITSNLTILCACGRLFASHKVNDEYLCPLCVTGLRKEDLVKLYETPVPDIVKKLFNNDFNSPEISDS